MEPPLLSPAETLKSSSRFLRGTIAEELLNDSDSFSKPTSALLKFHGAYQQDDRDLRKISPTKVYSSMVRVGIPGGGVTAAQYLELDRLADAAGDGTLRITSRQGVQYHYVGKRNLKALIAAINATGLGTWAACGDVVRNVTASPEPLDGRPDLTPAVRLVAREMKPKSSAYIEIWLDGEKAATFEEPEAEPLYGPAYLPRKFKFSFVHAGDNTVDVYANDLGFVAHSTGGELEGYTVLAGGGMGQSNGVKGSYPRLADPVCFIKPGEVLEVAKAAVTIHRDFGNRSNRKLARLKYVIQERGIAWFRQELEARLGRKVDPARPLTWSRGDDYLGWHRQGPGTWFYGLRIVSGRIKGESRVGLRKVIEEFQPAIRFTVQQNMLLCGIAEERKADFEASLRHNGIVTGDQLPPVLRHSMSCPALPTCGQAITESERTLPSIAEQVQSLFNSVHLDELPVRLRTTGCPNGCARPYTAEIGVVGESVNLYTLYLGGSETGERLAQPWRRLVPVAEIASTLEPLVARFAAERGSNEDFGDWFARVQPE
ncbi:MAG TPA: NADPH-dependent assimilatory sulfite reductase hemoprotein subunit [Bryobacteraceae bacterium]|nr:NADPH-dependent assimilatory sulfite reductase hemoprotein subunit [Bryobacteraceae bacterium]